MKRLKSSAVFRHVTHLTAKVFQSVLGHSNTLTEVSSYAFYTANIA